MIKVSRFFTKGVKSPFDVVTWVESRVVIKKTDGTVIYDNVVEHPISWGRNAVDACASKYLRKADIPGTGRETSVKQLASRVANCIAKHGIKNGYFDEANGKIFAEELIAGFLLQRIGFNSPVWFNYGLFSEYGILGSESRERFYVDSDGEVKSDFSNYRRPGGAACFLSSVEDSMFGVDLDNGLFDHILMEAKIFASGAGDGFNVSKVRSAGEPIYGGGISCGIIPFLAASDHGAGYTKSGGADRRSARLVALNDSHPDIEAFVTWKSSEEKKAKILIEHGYSSDIEGDAYHTIAGQNGNNSVRISDAFILAEQQDEMWYLYSRVDYNKYHDVEPFEALVSVGTSSQGELFAKSETDLPCAIKPSNEDKGVRKVVKIVRAKDLWNVICKEAWACGCPGLQFDDIVNAWNTVPHYGRINTTNPCFSGKTLVQTNTGLISMEDWAKSGEKRSVWSNGRWVEAKAVATKTEKTVTVEMTDGRSITVTADHRLMVSEEKEGTFGDLKKDQNVMIYLPEGGEYDEADDFFTALGYLQCDGSYNSTDKEYKYIYLGEDDNDVKKFVEGLGWDIKQDKGTTRFVLPEEIAKKCNYYLNCVPIPERVLKKEVVQLKPAELKKFLKGVFSANGSVMTGTKRISMKTTCYEFAQQVQQMLMIFGIRSGITTNAPRKSTFDNGTYTSKESYDLNLSSEDLETYRDNIGFLQEYKNKKLAQITKDSDYGFRHLPTVSSIKKNDEAEQVYDFQLLDESLDDSKRWASICGFQVHNCGEVALPDWSVCNLGSVNLEHFFEDLENPDLVGYEHACKLMATALDLVVDLSGYPTKQHAVGSVNMRAIGLNHGNIGSVLMRNGIPYDSVKGRRLIAEVTSMMTLFAYEQSMAIAKELGAYKVFKKDNHWLILERHRSEFENAPVATKCAQSVVGQKYYSAVVDRWKTLCDQVRDGAPLRNAATTCIVPQGTIGLVLGQDCLGIEPDFALIKFKRLVGGSVMQIANNSVKDGLKKLGYTDEVIEEAMKYILIWGAIEGAPNINTSHYAVFDTSIRIPTTLDVKLISEKDSAVADIYDAAKEGPVTSVLYQLPEATAEEIRFVLEVIKNAKSKQQAKELIMSACKTEEQSKNLIKKYGGAIKVFTRSIEFFGHLNALAATQPHISMSISKTINMDNDATIEDVSNAYKAAWKMGIKGITVYRDGSKGSQPLVTSIAAQKTKKKEESAEESQVVIEKVVNKTVWVPPSMVASGGHTFKIKILGQDPVAMYLRFDRYPGTDDVMNVFIDIGRQGQTVSGLLNAIARIVSCSVQHGVPIERLGETLVGAKYPPYGPLGKYSLLGIKHVDSISDLLGKLFIRIRAYWQAGKPDSMLHPESVKPIVAPVEIENTNIEITTPEQAKSFGYSGKRCTHCGGLRLRATSSTCATCEDCGTYNGPCGS